MPPTFQPPTASVVPQTIPNGDRLANRLMRHYGTLLRGRSVLKTGGVYQTVDTPSQAACDAATEVYLGGHVYEVSAAVADALIAAGYGVGSTAGGYGDIYEDVYT